MSDGRVIRSNPFSTRYVQPGACDYLLPDGETWAQRIEFFEANQGRVQVVGPHGAGKTTFVKALLRRLNGWMIKSAFLAADERDSTIVEEAFHELVKVASSNLRPLLVVDGFEQLSWWRRLSLVYRTNLHRMGLMVTTHRTQWGLPVLLNATSDPVRFELLVQELVRESTGDADRGSDKTKGTFDSIEEWLNSEVLRQVYMRHASKSDVREMLFDLYDHFQSHRK